eukprot:scaffold20806_cov107-Isochrysis_galbana.AAC.1
MPEDREPNAPDMPRANTRTPLHGPTGGVPSDKALSDTPSGKRYPHRPTPCLGPPPYLHSGPL